jgi:hypothetical protein
MRKPPHAALLLFVGLASACGSAAVSSESFPANALESMTSQNGSYRVEVRTAPQPPSRGAQSVEYTLTRSDTGEVAPGLSLSVVPWMPAMGHGTSLVPSVSEAAPGVYVATNVGWYMPGQWVLRTTIVDPAAGSDGDVDGGAAGDYVEPSFQIP